MMKTTTKIKFRGWMSGTRVVRNLRTVREVRNSDGYDFGTLVVGETNVHGKEVLVVVDVANGTGHAYTQTNTTSLVELS